MNDNLLFYNPDNKPITLQDRLEAEQMIRLLRSTSQEDTL
jgi:hypothetical protein